MNPPPIPSSLRHLDADPIVLADRNGVITYVNQRFMECYGWSAEIVGASLTRIIPATIDYALTDGRMKAQCAALSPAEL